MFEEAPRAVRRPRVVTAGSIVDSYNQLGTSWFDGTRSSIIRRQRHVSKLLRQARTLLADDMQSLDEQTELLSVLETLKDEAGQLEDLAEETQGLVNGTDDTIEVTPRFDEDNDVELLLNTKVGCSNPKNLLHGLQRYCKVNAPAFNREYSAYADDPEEMRREAVQHIITRTSKLRRERGRDTVFRFALAFADEVEKCRQEEFRRFRTQKTASRDYEDVTDLSDSSLYW